MENLIRDIECIKKQLSILEEQKTSLEDTISKLKKLNDDDEHIIPMLSEFIKQITSKYYILEDSMFELENILESYNKKK